MISLGTHQAATWGYSTYPHASVTTDFHGSENFIGSFTKPTLAPNGNMYSILGVTAINLSGTHQAFVIMKITPNTSNTATTNWQPSTITFITANTELAPLPNGFARPEWGAPSFVSTNTNDNSKFRFNTGILASNGLIYFPPVQCGSANNQWVILDPATDRWKVTNLLRPSGVSSISNTYIASAVLGTDNKIYVLPGKGGKAFRITTSVNAGADTVEDSYYSNYISQITATIVSPLTVDSMQWRDASNNLYTDVASLDSVTKAYAEPSGQDYETLFSIITDAVTHPSGRIYLIPGYGRGRIFYINQAAWGTSLELVSAPGLSTAAISGYGQKTVRGYYAFLEKQRDESHDKSTLKIYIAPRALALGNQSMDLLVINPVTNTMSAIDMGYSSSTGASGNHKMSKRISLPNGMTLAYNRLINPGNTRHGGMVLTGWDVPSSVSTGTRTIGVTGNGILINQNMYTIDSISPGFTGTGGGVNALWPHTGKHITFMDPEAGNQNIVEIVSVKGYGPNITNFNFTSRDQSEYQVPSNLALLGASVFNSQFNKPR